MQEFIKHLPKVELHIHIEGSLEPELMFKLAKRNQINIHYNTPEDVRNAYQFHNLQSFLDIYYQGANVLIHEQDFFDRKLSLEEPKWVRWEDHVSPESASIFPTLVQTHKSNISISALSNSGLFPLKDFAPPPTQNP